MRNILYTIVLFSFVFNSCSSNPSNSKEISNNANIDHPPKQAKPKKEENKTAEPVKEEPKKTVRFIPPPAPIDPYPYPDPDPLPGPYYGDPIDPPSTESKDEYKSDEPLQWAEVMPEFPGGQAEMLKFINKNLLYPELAKEMGIEGKVYIRFVVELDGSITNVVSLRAPDKSLEKEAIRVVKLMPKWTPAKNNGTTVRCYMTIPIAFKLN